MAALQGAGMEIKNSSNPQFFDRLERGLAGIALWLLIPLLVRNPSNIDYLPCWNWLNRLVDYLTVISEGGTIKGPE